MLEPIAALGAANSISSLEKAINPSEYILRLRDQRHVVRQLELDVQVNLQKFRAWQKKWSGDKKYPDAYGQALWGVKGWTHIRRMLDGIEETSRSLADYLDGLRKTEENNPRSRWKKAVKAIQTKKGPSLEMQKLQELSTTLTRAVDELWIYSETVFESLHPVSSLDSMVPESDRLLRNALRSRPCSLELYYHCLLSKLHCSLEMDLFDSAKAPSMPSEAPPSVTYHLVAQSCEARGDFKQMAIESVETSATEKPETDGMSVQKMENLQLFQSTGEHGTTLFRVAARGSAQFTYFRIPQKNNRSMTLDSGPESLANLLNRRQSANFSMQEHLSVGVKVELAYKVVECGFFLLGTPWFASLSSKNLLRLKKSKRTHYSFCLETQTLDLDDLLYDDPGALAETSQLLRLGVLLMEIALGKPLGKPNIYTRSDETGQEADRIRNLPLVEQNMGAQYCRATAFCLQYQQSGTPFKTRKISKEDKSGKDRPFLETEKYESPNFDDWQRYLAGLLQQYYSQVYIRIQALRETLREVDSVAEQRSVNSSQEPVKDKGD